MFVEEGRELAQVEVVRRVRAPRRDLRCMMAWLRRRRSSSSSSNSR